MKLIIKLSPKDDWFDIDIFKNITYSSSFTHTLTHIEDKFIITLEPNSRIMDIDNFIKKHIEYGHIDGWVISDD